MMKIFLRNPGNVKAEPSQYSQHKPANRGSSSVAAVAEDDL